MTKKQSKPLTYEEMREIANQRERENAFAALDRLYEENGEALRRLAMSEDEDRTDFPKQETENPDEIIVQDIETFHMEMMNENEAMWIGITRKDGQIDHLQINIKDDILSVLWTPATGHTDPNHSLNQ
jgi:hypothetical protein